MDADAFSHEAGFDAWMTGASFALLLKLHAAAAGAPAAPAMATKGAAAGGLQEGAAPPLSAVAGFSGRLSLSWCARGLTELQFLPQIFRALGFWIFAAASAGAQGTMVWNEGVACRTSRFRGWSNTPSTRSKSHAEAGVSCRTDAAVDGQ